MQEFISETISRSSRMAEVSGPDAAPPTPEEFGDLAAPLRETRERSATSPKVRLMKLQPVPGEHRTRWRFGRAPTSG